MKASSEVPKGKHCFEFVRISDEYRLLELRPCKYWGVDENRNRYCNGKCNLLDTVDWELDKPALWDRIKICGINK